MSSARNSLPQSEKRPASGSLRKITMPGRVTESITKELNEALSGVIINTSTCFRMLAADPPKVEGARETARRAIRSSMRAAEAISLLHDLLSETNDRTVMVAPSREGSSTVTPGATS